MTHWRANHSPHLDEVILLHRRWVEVVLYLIEARGTALLGVDDFDFTLFTSLFDGREFVSLCSDVLWKEVGR